MSVPFSARHIGPDATETSAMLKVLGAASLDDFIAKAVPAKLRAKRALALEPALSEAEALAKIKHIASVHINIVLLLVNKYRILEEQLKYGNVKDLKEFYGFN